MTLANSERVVLRRLGPDDVAPFMAYRSDLEVARFQGWEAMDSARTLGFLAHCATAPLLEKGEWGQLALAEGGQLIGDVGVHLAKDGSEAELGITLSRAAQGKGLGFEAVTLVCDWLFAQTQIGRIVAITHAGNARALALLRRSAFRHTHDTNDVLDGVPTPECWFELRRG